MSLPIPLQPNPLDAAAISKAIHASLEDALAAIPAGHTKALLVDAHYTEQDGFIAQAIFAQRLPGGWNLDAAGGYYGHAGAGAGIQIEHSW